MSFPRLAAAAAALAMASGAGLLLSSATGAATTPSPPTPVTLEVGGMASAACPLPLNAAIAVRPGTAALISRGTTLALSSTLTLTVSPEPGKTDPASHTAALVIPATGLKVTFPGSMKYTLKWVATTAATVLKLGVSTTYTGNITTNGNTAQTCVLGVQLPVPSLSASALPSAVTSPINGALSSVAGVVNGALSPVNSAVGPPLGGVEQSVGGLPTAINPSAGKPVAQQPPAASGPGTTYKPSDPTVADRTVPHGYGNGSGQGGSFVSVTGGSINAPALGFVTSDGKRVASSSSSSAAVKSGGSPKTVDLASKQPKSALGSLPALAVIVAVIALSAATAFYARTFLLQPAAARVKP